MHLLIKMQNPSINPKSTPQISTNSTLIHLDLTKILLKLIQEKTDLRQYQPGSRQLDSWEIRQLLLFEGYHYLIPKVPQENILIPIQTKPTSAFFTYDKPSFTNVFPNYVELYNGLIVSESIAQMSGFNYKQYFPKKEVYLRYK